MIRQVYLVIRYFVIHSTLSYMCLYLNVYNILAEQRSMRDSQAMFDSNGGDVTWPLTQHLRSCVMCSVWTRQAGNAGLFQEIAQ